MKPERQAYANSYNGPVTERTPVDCANEWRKLGLGSIDSLLSEQLAVAAQAGKNKVTVLDIGSGKEAKLLHAIMTDRSIAPESRRFLSSHPRMSFQLIGLTDAIDEQSFGQTTIQDTVQEPDIRGIFKNVAYTLTAAQTLGRFLEQEEISEINLGLATWSLAYLPPGIFGEVVGTTVNHLASKGRFLGVGYNDTVSGIGFKYHPNKDVVHFSVASKKLPPNLWESLLFSNGPGETEVSPDIKDYFRRVISSPSIPLSGQRRGNLHETTIHAATFGDMKPVAMNLKDPMRRLWEFKFEGVFKPAKASHLDQVKNVTPDISLDRVSPNLFSIQKH